ncbi:MAG TPA: glycosyltransferase family 4 protein [Gemmatimonadaceae bacterium]|jgi:UDP-glucose:(heptosyl)LPS alpha-1,3-glucosyltransferase
MTFSLAFIAHQVHRRGGQERAAAEVLTRIARRVRVTIIASECELPAARVTWRRIAPAPRPLAVGSFLFARAARVEERRAGCTITNCIGASAFDADVITAQYCHAAFTARFGGLRGGSTLGRAWQRAAQQVFVQQERRSYGARRLRRVIAVSHGTARELQEFYGVPAAKIAVVPNGVDHAVFRPAADAAAKRALRASLGISPDAFVALFCGGDWERKGLRDAIDAVAGVPDALLCIVGRGDETAMRAHAARCGAADRVHFAGLSTTPERWYAAADVMLHPSRYEAFSLVTLEGAAAGLPIITHAINGTEELIASGVNGFLVPFGGEALREPLLALRDDAARRATMSAAAVERSRRYAWDRVAAEYFDVLAEAAS